MGQNVAEELASATGRSYIEAPAGYGKTQTIAEALLHCSERQLILTHTHAGVDSLRKRLKGLGVPSSGYRLDTIDAFCLKLARGYPASSGAPDMPDPAIAPIPYSEFHRGTARILRTQGIQQVIAAGYGGLIVDEYQDCSATQHEVVLALAEIVPTRVLGDPLQRLLGFSENPVIEWSKDVEPLFQRLSDLSVPYRWLEAGADPAIGEWLSAARLSLKAGNAPKYGLPVNVRTVEPAGALYGVVAGLKFPEKERAVILHRFAREMHGTATRLSGLGYSCMEEIEAKDLKASCLDLDDLQGFALAAALIRFAGKCCTNPKQSLDRILDKLDNSNISGLEKLVPLSVSGFVATYASGFSLESSLELLDIVAKLEGRALYRRELYYSMRRTLQLKLSKPELTLVQAAQEVRQRVSHGGRREERRIVSRPILVKGLQFEHVVIVNPHLFGREELYVALSRATKSVTVVGPVMDRIEQKGKSTGAKAVPKATTASPLETPSLFD